MMSPNPCIALRTDSHFIDRETEALKDFKLSQDLPVIDLFLIYTWSLGKIKELKSTLRYYTI